MNEKLSQNEVVREVSKQLCKRFGRIKEKNAENVFNIEETLKNEVLASIQKAFSKIKND